MTVWFPSFMVPTSQATCWTMYRYSTKTGQVTIHQPKKGRLG